MTIKIEQVLKIYLVKNVKVILKIIFSFHARKPISIFAQNYLMDQENMLERYALALKEENYPPIAGKIMGLFFISNQKYFTFEEIMTSVQASKSATSKAIKLLISSGEVNFKFVEGNKRKRHFYLDIEGSIAHFKRLIEGLYMQTTLYQETLKMRTDENEKLSQFIQNTINFNKELLVHAERLLQEHFLK